MRNGIEVTVLALHRGAYNRHERNLLADLI